MLTKKKKLLRIPNRCTKKIGGRSGNLFQEIDKYDLPDDCIIPLTEQEELFCQSFICKPNATQSAIDAGYPHPAVTGSALKRRLTIRLRLSQLYQERKKKFLLDKEDVLEELSKIGSVDINDFIDINGNGTINVKPGNEINGRMIRSISTTKDKWGDVQQKLEFWDKNKALESLCKYHKLFMDTIDGGESSKVQQVRIGDMVVSF